MPELSAQDQALYDFLAEKCRQYGGSYACLPELLAVDGVETPNIRLLVLSFRGLVRVQGVGSGYWHITMMPQEGGNR